MMGQTLLGRSPHLNPEKKQPTFALVHGRPDEPNTGSMVTGDIEVSLGQHH
jgi:hypothetical protein